VVSKIDLVEAGFVFEVSTKGVVGRGDGEKAAGIGICITDIGAVLHLEGHTDMMHKGGHSVDLGGGAGTGEGVGHIVPIVGGGAEISASGGIGAGRVGVRTVTSSGVVPVFHDLGGGGGHATGWGI